MAQPDQEERPSAIRVLPPEYNANEDRGAAAFELFADWMVQPESVFLRRNEVGETIVLAYGGYPIVV